LFVIAPIGKRNSYGINPGPYGTPYLELPPWTGPIYNPAQPAGDGHFDAIDVNTPEFAQAHVFGTARFLLAIWEQYFGRPIRWHFAPHFERLEVLLVPNFNGARAGYGFMELGSQHNKNGTKVPYALNFDVIAHELGHLIIYATLGVPSGAEEHGEYFGFQESAADTVALVSALHFSSLVDNLLNETRGNLYTFNELNRFAELSATQQIRLASNSTKLSKFSAGWTNEHPLSEPLTGALFDIFVDIFLQGLVERRLISREIADLSDHVRQHPEYEATIQAAFDAAYPGQEHGFRQALIAARDYGGLVLTETWQRLSADRLTYSEVAETMIGVDLALTGGRYRRAMVESFNWREIGRVRVGPRLLLPDRHSHTFSARTIVPEMRHRLPRMSYREQALVAGNNIKLR
jgi:hypothetical protein